MRRQMERSPGWGARAYRTHAGLRCLLTHDTFDPTAASTAELMGALGADPLYVKLIETLGSGWTHPEVQRILPVHDERTRVSRPLALA